jgi:hypothetical protein
MYELWSARGANFLTPLIDRGVEIRCYLRDPDGHLIKVGQQCGERVTNQHANGGPLPDQETDSAQN